MKNRGLAISLAFFSGTLFAMWLDSVIAGMCLSSILFTLAVIKTINE